MSSKDVFNVGGKGFVLADVIGIAEEPMPLLGQWLYDARPGGIWWLVNRRWTILSLFCGISEKQILIMAVLEHRRSQNLPPLHIMKPRDGGERPVSRSGCFISVTH